jgi:UDP-glucose 4-epimerase
MHFAANALVGESMANPHKYFHNNVYGGLNLLRAAAEGKVERFVFSSTCATYGIPERVPIDEETPQNPINPYGESKLMFEKILRWFDQIHRIKYVALRYFNAAGASERFGEHHRIETHLIPRILAVALEHSQYAEIFGTDYPTPDGTCIRDYIHISDLAQAHILALSTAESGCFNLGTGGGVSVYEVIEACREVTGHKIPVVEKPRRPGDPPRLVAASEKAKNQLGWTPKYQDIREIVKSAWAWHAKHPNGYSD